MLQLFNVPAHFVFQSENRPECLSFVASHFGGLADHVFIDADDFGKQEECRGRCMMHDFNECSLDNMGELEIDVLFASFSCNPYTTIRTSRRSGTKEHKEAHHQELFLKVWERVRPKAVVMEQVFGYAMAESTQDKTTPLQHLIAKVGTMFPQWGVSVFYMHGNTFMIFVRHRIYMVALHESAGGSVSLEMLKRIVTAARLVIIH